VAEKVFLVVTAIDNQCYFGMFTRFCIKL